MNGPAVVESPGRVSWQDASLFAELNAQHRASPNPNPVQELWPWFKAVELYHEAEMVGAPTERHRHWLSVLINLGEWLVFELRKNDVTANMGVTLADVEATVEELYISQRVSFGGMTEARRVQVLQEVFGAS